MKINRKVLIIEDDTVMRLALVEIFQKANFAVMAASDGVSGLQSALDNKPDLLILDINLPGMSGLNVMQSLRETSSEWGENVKIILLTNLMLDNDMLETVAKYNPAFYLLKADVELDDLVARANECLTDQV